MTEKSIRRGDRIRSLREEKGYTQAQLGDIIGVKDTHISKWENGSGISRKYIIKLSNALDTNESFIEKGEKNENTVRAEEAVTRYESRKYEKEASDKEREILLEYLRGQAESLSEGLRRLADLDKRRENE